MAAPYEATLSKLYPSLLDACGRGDIDTVNYLLDQGLDVNHIDEDGKFPLRLACSFGHVNVANLLLKRGAKMDLINSLKEPLEFKGKHDNWGKMLKLISDYGAREGAISIETKSSVGTVSHLETTPSLVQLIKELFSLRSQWQNFGLFLGVPSSVLDTIQCDHSRSCEDCLRELLRWWLNHEPQPTWRKVKDAVEYCDPFVADKILRHITDS